MVLTSYQVPYEILLLVVRIEDWKHEDWKNFGLSTFILSIFIFVLTSYCKNRRFSEWFVRHNNQDSYFVRASSYLRTRKNIAKLLKSSSLLCLLQCAKQIRYTKQVDPLQILVSHQEVSALQDPQSTCFALTLLGAKPGNWQKR